MFGRTACLVCREAGMFTGVFIAAGMFTGLFRSCVACKSRIFDGRLRSSAVGVLVACG